MFEFFKMAEANRNPLYREIPLHVLMKDAASRAGWYLEFVPNLKSKTKYQVRYQRPFDSEVVAELVCRMRKYIIGFLKKREIDPTTIDSYLGWGFFNFIKTYKPDVHDTDEKIRSAIYRSVQNKVDQSNRKEIFKYRPTDDSLRAQNGENIPRKKENGKKKHLYTRTPKEISSNKPRTGKNDEEGDELGNFIPDSSPSPLDCYLDQEDREELSKEFTKSRTQEILLNLLIEAGKNGKLALKDLKKEAILNEEILQETFDELKITLEKREGDSVEIHITKEMVYNRVNRKVKTFYKGLKKKLSIKFSI